MKKIKNSYMVPVQYLMPVTIYHEVIATSGKDAAKQVRTQYKSGRALNSTAAKAFQEEARTEAGDHWFIGGKVRVFTGDRASTFHSDHECELCAEVQSIKAKSGRK